MSITPEQIAEFRQNGVVVIEDILTDEEVDQAREAFHEQLMKIGIDHHKILSGESEVDQAPRIKSNVSRLFYAKWKLLDVQLHPNVVQAASELLDATFGSDDPLFRHPYGRFDGITAYNDRVCWRLPDSIRPEGGLGVHLDRNPIDPYLEHSGGLEKWRPIQGLVALTDHYGGDSGGLRVVKGFHHRIDDFFAKSDLTYKDTGGGEFFRMHSMKYAALAKECQPVYAPRGSFVMWDNRLAHATCQTLAGNDSREVVYTGFLPNVAMNQPFIKKQMKAIRQNRPPPPYVGSNPKETVDRDWVESDLTDMQKQLLGMY